MSSRFLGKLNLITVAVILCPSASFGQSTTSTPGSTGSAGASAASVAKKTTKKASGPLITQVDTSIVTVTVRPISTVIDGTFTLGEIADIRGADKSLIEQLTKVPVGTSPLPGFNRLMIPGDVTIRLKASHMESTRVQVFAPDTFRVARMGNDVSGDDLLKAAMAAGQDAIKDIPGASLETLQPPTKVTLPAGKLMLLAGASTMQPDGSTLLVPVTINVDGKNLRTVDVQLRLHRKTTVVVAIHQIEAHSIVTAADVALSFTDLPAGFSNPLTDLRDAIGKRATQRFLANAPLPASALDTPPVITANDKVNIEYIVGAIRITAPGLARQSGGIGDTIHVYSTDGKRELDGTVVDSHTVRIFDADPANNR